MRYCILPCNWGTLIFLKIFISFISFISFMSRQDASNLSERRKGGLCMKYLCAAELARELDVSYTTVFNWGKKGLLNEAYRTPSGRKMYAADDVEKLRRGKYRGGEICGSSKD